MQIAWALTDNNGRELRTQAFVVRPDGFDIPVSVEKRRGITTETALRLGVDVAAILRAFAKDLTNAKAVVAHNANYDERVIRAEFYRTGRRMNPFGGKKLYCTMRASTGLCKLAGGPSGYKWPTLQELHQFLFNTGIESAHDAAADVRACVRCFIELKHQGFIGDDELFQEIYRLADSSDGFDRGDFVNDVFGQFEDQGFITLRQREALTRIRDMLLRKTEPRGAARRPFHALKWWKPRQLHTTKEQA